MSGLIRSSHLLPSDPQQFHCNALASSPLWHATAPFILLNNSLSVDQTRYGWTAGFGAEYALGGNWSVKAEYLRVMLGDTTVNVPFDPANSSIGETGSIKVSQNIDLIRAGINYKFGGPAGGRY